MRVRRAVSACSQAAALGGLARRAANARSMALSTVCQSAAARGLSPASASSHDVSRSLMRVFAPERSLLSTSAFVSSTIARNCDRSPSLDGEAACASVTIEELPVTNAAPASVGAAARTEDMMMAPIRFRTGIVILLCCECDEMRWGLSSDQADGCRSRLVFRQDRIHDILHADTDEGYERDDK